MNSTIAMMLAVSIFLAFCAVAALIWGIKNKQFDDKEKFLNGTQFDSVDALNDAYQRDLRKKEALKDENKDYKTTDKGYAPPD